MAAQYRLTLWRRALNQLVRALLRVGFGPRHTYLWTVRGRKSGAAAGLQGRVPQSAHRVTDGR